MLSSVAVNLGSSNADTVLCSLNSLFAVQCFPKVTGLVSIMASPIKVENINLVAGLNYCIMIVMVTILEYRSMFACRTK